jgi:hypothetical protein
MTPSWKTIPLPPNMVDLPKDKRGFPVPYVVLIKDGEPVFTVNDTYAVIRAVVNELCGICGKPLDDAWMVGGPESAFNPHGVYVDSPVHHDCGAYALQVCPYLAMSAYRGAVDVQKLQEKWPDLYLKDYTQNDRRVPFFVMGKVNSWSRDMSAGYIHIGRPFLLTEYWNGGEQLKYEQAKALKPDWPDYYPKA